jgi:Zn-finger nucleic acid-binding protein
MLDHTFEGVSSCLRCEGLWISPATLDAAFGSATWPPGQTLWWRNSIECPECAFDGTSTLMTARISNDVIVDQCTEHGVWLDRGELGRLMGTPADELEALRARLLRVAPDLEQLVARREQWRVDVEIRRKAALDYRQAVEAEQRRRSEVAESERLRLEAGVKGRTQAATAPTQMLPTTRRAQRSDPPPAKTTTEIARRQAKRRQSLGTQLTPVVPTKEAEEQAAVRLQELGAQRAQASADVGVLQGRLVALDEHIRRLDAQLADARQHAAAVRDELNAARMRLRALDEQLGDPT